jgi:hypothetical protein
MFIQKLCLAFQGSWMKNIIGTENLQILAPRHPYGPIEVMGHPPVLICAG